MISKALRTLAVATLGLASITGCSASTPTSAPDTLTVTAGFYPLQYVAEQVGGTHVTVTNLTKPGAEAHDLEIPPRSVNTIAESSVVLYLKGFQPAVDEAVAQNAPEAGFDVGPAARVEPASDNAPDAGTHSAETHSANPHSAETHSADSHGADPHGADPLNADPHVWLDPMRLADVADAVAARFAEADPDHADEYTANAAALRTELTQLDTDYRTGLASCQITEVVSAHTAFGYLTRRYGLQLIGISGIDPTSEPSPAVMAQVSERVTRDGITTIYTETVASPALTETIAAETGARTAVLNPLESLKPGDGDYPSVMRQNLDTLRTGQRCA